MKRVLLTMLALLAVAGMVGAQEIIMNNGAEPQTLDPLTSRAFPSTASTWPCSKASRSTIPRPTGPSPASRRAGPSAKA